jgi:hypothetical protein
MPDEHPFTLRQVDLARADFAAIESHLDILHQQLARVPTRRNLLDIAVLIILCTTGLVSFVGWLALH